MPRSARAHHAPATMTLPSVGYAQDGGHVQVVGDDAQALVVQQRLGNGSVVVPMFQDQRAVVGHGLCRTARANAGFPIERRVSRWLWAMFSTVSLARARPMEA